MIVFVLVTIYIYVTFEKLAVLTDTVYLSLST